MIYHLFRRPKKNGVFWMDLRVNDCRYRESLGTHNRQEAGERMTRRMEQLREKAPDPAKRSKSYGSMSIQTALETYTKERRAQVSPRMISYWKEQARPLAKRFGELKLKRLTLEHLSEYQNARLDEGRALKTINGELSVLRQLLKHCKLWYRFADYKPVLNNRAPVGRALTEAEQARLFETAKSRPDWQYAYVAAILGAFCGLRACEIKGLQWKDVDFQTGVIGIRRSKTPAGWRSPSLNSICRERLAELYAKASLINAAQPEHYVFPWHGREQKIDPTRPMTSWRSAWRSIRHKAARNDEGEIIYPNLDRLRFHDLRHCCVTTLCEKGLPDSVIMAQVGHVSPEMIKTYSHIRRQALNVAAQALEPVFLQQPTQQAEMVN